MGELLVERERTIKYIQILYKRKVYLYIRLKTFMKFFLIGNSDTRYKILSIFIEL